MDLQSEKLAFIEEVLQVESSALLHQLREYLHALKRQPTAQEEDFPAPPPRNAAEIEANYQQAVREMQTGDVYTQAELLALTRQWRPA